MPLAKPSRRSLIIAPATVTESVLTQPLLALLRRLDPLGRIDVVARPELAPVFAAMAEADDVIETDIDNDRIALLRRLALARTIVSRGYDRAFVLQENRTAAIAPWLARIPARIGPAGGNGRRGKSIADRYLALALPPGDSLPPGIPAPQLVSPPAMTEALARHLGLDVGRQLILLSPVSELGPSSEWPVRHYAELAALITLQWPELVVGLLGGPGDRPVATQIALLSGERLHNWCGRLDTAQTLALMSHCAAVVTSESQYMHLAAALGRPHVALYGAGDPRAERINGSRRSVMWLHLGCSPCLDAHCKYGHMNCVTQQMPAQVFAALRKTMRFSATA